MAIPFNLPNIAAEIPLKSSVPDYMGALKQGMELGYMPRHHENEEYAQELANKINEAKAKYAMQQEEATLRGKQGSLGLLPLRKQILQAKYQDALYKANRSRYYQKMLDDYITGKGSNNSAAAPIAQPIKEQPVSFAEQLLNSVPREEVSQSGMGMFSAEPEQLMSQAHPGSQGQQLPFGINKDDFLKAMFYKQAGLTPPSSAEHVLTGSAREAESMYELEHKYGKDSDVVKKAIELEKSKDEAKKSLQERRENLTNAMAYQSLPSDEKQRVIATAVGMGFDPIEAATKLSRGESLNQMADEKGVKLNDVNPVFPLSGESRKNLIKRKAFVQEIGSLEKNINEATKGFGQRIGGYSPEQIAGAIRNDDPDKQGKYLAAVALQPELMTIRLNAMNGRVGIQAIKHLTDAAHANAKAFDFLINDEVRGKMNAYLSDYIGQAVGAFSNAEQQSARLGRGAQLESNSKEGSQDEGRITIDTSKYNIPKGWKVIYKKGIKGQDAAEVYPPEKADKLVESGKYTYD